jgi:alkylhydroperoxidase family enzyme
VSSLVDAVLEGEGSVDRTVRHAAFQRTGVPAALSSLVDNVRDCAYRVTDEDLDHLRASGYRDDQIFEVLVAAALGAGWVRLEQAMQALRET